MGIVVTLRTYEGEPVRGLPDPAGGVFDAAGDFDELLSVLDASFAALKAIDPLRNDRSPLGRGRIPAC